MTMHIISVRNTCKKLDISRTTLFRLEQTEDFPRKRRIGSKRVGFVEAEIDAWIESR
jgi:predicted DNA-binding transcriptional regulator AlpA